MNQREAVDLAGIFRALGDPSRLRLLHILHGGERCVKDLACQLGITPSAVSHQLRLLRGLRLVRYRRDGKHIYYALDDDHVHSLIREGLDHVRHP